MESASFLFYALVSMNKYNVLSIVYRLNLIVLLKGIWDKTIFRKKAQYVKCLYKMQVIMNIKKSSLHVTSLLRKNS